MKKHIALIYRLAFILFAVWGLTEYMGYSWQPERLLGFAPLTDLLCLIIILIIFIFTLKKEPAKAFYEIKGALTLLAFMVLIIHSHMFFRFFTGGYITAVLLPFMMLLDFLFFDKKGNFSPRDLIIWLALAALVAALAGLFDFPWLSDISDFLKDKDNLIKLLLGTLFAALLMYLLSCLFGGGVSKGTEAFNAMLLRLIFLILEGWCYAKIAGASLGTFIKSLKYYSLFINFLCFLCIAVTVLYSTITLSSKKSSVFPRIKVCLAADAVLLPIFFGVYEGSIFGNGLVCWLLCIVCPLIMLADCLFFDRKGAYRPLDPFLWLIIPTLHFLLTYFVLRPYFGLTTYYHVPYNAFALFGTGMAVLLAIGYFIFIINSFIKRK